MLPIIHSRCAASAALRPGRATERGGLGWHLGTGAAQYGCRVETRLTLSFPFPSPCRRANPLGALKELTVTPCLCSAFILCAPQSTLVVTHLPASLRKISATGSVTPSYFTPSCCKGSLLRGKGKDGFPLCSRCPMVTKHQKCIPKPAPAAVQGPWWMAQLPSAVRVPKHHQGVPRPLTRLRRYTRYS